MRGERENIKHPPILDRTGRNGTKYGEHGAPGTDDDLSGFSSVQRVNEFVILFLGVCVFVFPHFLTPSQFKRGSFKQNAATKKKRSLFGEEGCQTLSSLSKQAEKWGWLVAA